MPCSCAKRSAPVPTKYTCGLSVRIFFAARTGLRMCSTQPTPPARKRGAIHDERVELHPAVHVEERAAPGVEGLVLFHGHDGGFDRVERAAALAAAPASPRPPRLPRRAGARPACHREWPTPHRGPALRDQPPSLCLSKNGFAIRGKRESIPECATRGGIFHHGDILEHEATRETKLCRSPHFRS